jgi:hypothetical protein
LNCISSKIKELGNGLPPRGGERTRTGGEHGPIAWGAEAQEVHAAVVFAEKQRISGEIYQGSESTYQCWRKAFRDEETIGKWDLSRRELIGLTETEIPELVPEIENLEMFGISVWEIA